MLKRTLITIFLIVFAYFKAYCQSGEILQAAKILKTRGELCFSFSTNSNNINKFTNIISIDNFDGTKVVAYANEEEFQKFLETKTDFTIIENIANTKALTMATKLSEMSNWNRYPTYDVYIEMMQKFASDFPEICKLDTIGYSVQNRLLLTVKISDNVTKEEAEPEIFYSAQMHGDELVCGILFLRLIDYLLNEYATNKQVQNLVDNLQIYINPFANPDGTYRGGNSSVSSATRYNNNYVDINRNFPCIIGSNVTPERETKAMMDFAEKHNFVLAANSHSGAEVINYPFDEISSLPADNEWWKFVCKEYATNAQNDSPSGYFTDINNGVTNGYAWYSVNGGRQDYMNYYHNCREVTLELSTTKMVDAHTLPNYWNYNKQAFLDYMEQATYGLRGNVTDSITGEPLIAKISIKNHDKNNSHVYSNKTHGDYYRLLYEGNYEVEFSANDYAPKTFNVSIENYKQSILNVKLVKKDYTLPTADFEFEIINNIVSFTNKSENFDSLYWNFGDGNFSKELNPTHKYNSIEIFNVKLKASNEFGNDEIEKKIEIINLSIDKINPENIIVYPNPTSETINLIAENRINYVEIKDISGKIIKSTHCNNTNAIINVQNLSPGIYFLGIKTQDKFLNIKILKE